MKVFTIIGTRPEAIKMAPVIRGLANRQDQIESQVVSTGQHRQMLDQVLNIFQIQPDYDLEIMQHSQTLFQITRRILTGLEKLLRDEQPDVVLVQGDTTTAFTAALAASYLKIRVGHVEAGLRTYDKYQPYPEEMNRRMVSALADMHFAPTEKARDNLLREGVSDNLIYVTGNPVVDALTYITSLNRNFENRVLAEFDFKEERVLLVTAHRRENWGEPMKNICHALCNIVQKYHDVRVIFSVHMNPEVQKIVHAQLDKIKRIHLLKPLDYVQFVRLMSKAHLILTDSGGVQEEAPSLGKPVLVLREVTERPEGVEAGVLRMVGTSIGQIVDETSRLLDSSKAYNGMAEISNPYGDGHAAERIVQILTEGCSWI
jgi:UDP-N-acetylglucosamine 2-epimerase (non-hydrolysing)